MEDTLPLEVVAEIFCRLPVKLLVQLRCMCKPWNSLISDHQFTRKHLSLSTTRCLHYAEYVKEPYRFIHNSYPLESVLTDMPTRFIQPRIDLNSIYGSCDGILCIADKRKGVVVLWNPSIRKLKELPPFETPEILGEVYATYGFGYDHVSHNYKVVVLYSSETLLHTTKVKLHTLGTNLWKTIHNFPFGVVFASESGTYVGGTLNWVAYTGWRRQGPLCIISFDLRNDSYRKLLPPVDAVDAEISQIYLTLSVLSNCLCLISNHQIWVMKEYGVWTRLYSVYMPNPYELYDLSRVLYIFEDGRLLLEAEESEKTKVFVYDPNNDTFKITTFRYSLNVCRETLISPC